MTDKDKQFCDIYLSNNFNATDAYRQLHPKASERTCIVNGGKKLTNTDIKVYIQSRQMELSKRQLLSREQLIHILEDIALNGSRDSDKVKAIETINKMCGYNAPTETNINMNLEQPLFGPENND